LSAKYEQTQDLRVILEQTRVDNIYMDSDGGRQWLENGIA